MPRSKEWFKYFIVTVLFSRVLGGPENSENQVSQVKNLLYSTNVTTRSWQILGNPQKNESCALAFVRPEDSITLQLREDGIFRLGNSTSDFLTYKRSENTTTTVTTLNLPTTIQGELQLTQNLRTWNNSNWYLWSLETFDNGDSFGWTDNRMSTCGASLDIFLGGHCNYGGKIAIEKTFTNIPQHNSLRITGRVHFLDQWENESLILEIDGKVKWIQAHRWCDGVLRRTCTRHGIDFCGTGIPDKLSSFFVVNLAGHSRDTVALKFRSTLPDNKDACDAAWGIDDIAIYLNDNR